MARMEALSYYREQEVERRQEEHEAKHTMDTNGHGHGYHQGQANPRPENVDADTWQNLPAKMKRHDDLVVNQQELEKHKQRMQQQ